jgi:hypothetical protein
VYAEPDVESIDAISAYERADRRATIPETMNEMIIDGPA